MAAGYSTSFGLLDEVWGPATPPVNTNGFPMPQDRSSVQLDPQLSSGDPRKAMEQAIQQRMPMQDVTQPQQPSQPYLTSYDDGSKRSAPIYNFGGGPFYPVQASLTTTPSVVRGSDGGNSLPHNEFLQKFVARMNELESKIKRMQAAIEALEASRRNGEPVPKQTDILIYVAAGAFLMFILEPFLRRRFTSS